MWGSEPSTKNTHRLHVIREVKTCQLVQLPPNYPPLGPYPIGDSFGYGLDVELMLRSLDSGRQSTRKNAFDTVRKQRAVFSGVWRASSSVQSREMIVSGAATKKMTVSRCPAYCVWFDLLMKGLEKYMDRETRPDLALNIKVMIRVMKLLEDDWRTTLDEEELRFLSFTGLFLIVGLLVGLRGYKLMCMDLTGLFDKRKKRRKHPL